jgi:hypothetical protein
MPGQDVTLWGSGVPIEERTQIGICYGQPVNRRDRYFGLHALIGVRLCFRGQFDQICSHSVSSLGAF